MNKVAKFEILKPVEGDWKSLGSLLRDTQYTVARLANAYMAHRMFYSKAKREGLEVATKTMGDINKDFGLCSYITDGMNKDIKAATSESKWLNVLKGNERPAFFKRDCAIPYRADRRTVLHQLQTGDVVLDLLITTQPYRQVILKTWKLDGSKKVILERLLCGDYGVCRVELKEKDNKWFALITFEFAPEDRKLNPDKIVGVDIGYRQPLVAYCNGKYLEGFDPSPIRRLQSFIISTRRKIQRGYSISGARKGHGRKRALLPITRLQSKIDNCYTTFNHTLASKLIKFAIAQDAGTIQIEDLKGMDLSGTFLGSRWRYFQLQEHIKYKAKEAGITVVTIPPAYTSRYCSDCGYINQFFDQKFRRTEPNMKCENCEAASVDGDLLAAKNISFNDIEKRILAAQEAQGIEVHKHRKANCKRRKVEKVAAA